MKSDGNERKLLRGFAVSQGAGDHILLENLVEVVGAGEARSLGNLVDRRIGSEKEHKSVIDTGGVDIVNGSFANAVLEHLGEIVGRYGDHLRQGLYVNFLTVMGGNILYNGAQAHNVVVYHTVKLVFGTAIIAQECRHNKINIGANGKLVANVL
jgi:hypothetical protein